jgi:hypothetical protein
MRLWWLIIGAAVSWASGALAQAPAPQQETVARIEALGGRVYRGANGHVDIISLSGTATADADLLLLQSVSTVRSLDLNDTQVTDAGLAHLMNLPDLEEVFLRKTRVTEAAALALKDRHPKVYHVEVSPPFQPRKLAFAALLGIPLVLGVWLMAAAQKRRHLISPRIYARGRGMGLLLILGSALLMLIAVLQAVGYEITIASLFG